MNYYSRDKMLEEGIPFIWENKQIYMPFLGILLQKFLFLHRNFYCQHFMENGTI
jgi:hypothetical protein